MGGKIGTKHKFYTTRVAWGEGVKGSGKEEGREILKIKWEKGGERGEGEEERQGERRGDRERKREKNSREEGREERERR